MKLTVNFNSNNVSFGSKFIVKGENIDKSKSAHAVALGTALGISKNQDDLVYGLIDTENLKKYSFVFDIDNRDDIDIVNLFNAAGIKFNMKA